MKEKAVFSLGVVFVALLVGSGLVSGAVGIYITQETVLGAPGEMVCLTYGAYNPVSEDTTIEVSVSEELQPHFLSSSWENNRRDIPGDTASVDAVPVEVCFTIPENAYSDDRKCEGEVQEYSGNVVLTEVAGESTGGSATTTAVVGPATLRASCVPQTRNYTVFLLITLIILVVAIIILLLFKFKHKKNPVVQSSTTPNTGNTGNTGGYQVK